MDSDPVVSPVVDKCADPVVVVVVQEADRAADVPAVVRDPRAEGPVERIDGKFYTQQI